MSAGLVGEGGTGCHELRHTSRRHTGCIFRVVDVVVDGLTGREDRIASDLEQPDLSRQAHGALSGRRQA